MESLTRLAGYLWPYRYPFTASILCALAVAALWCANLSVIAPMTKVLFEHDSLHDYVDDTIETASASIQADRELLASGEVTELGRQAKIQGRISDATKTIHLYTNIQTYVMPWLPRDGFNVVAVLVFAVVMGTILKCGFIYLQEILVGSIVTRTANDIRRDCFRSAQKLDLQSVEHEGTANLLARMTNDINQVTLAVSVFGTKVIREPLKALACIGMAFAINWRLTLMAVLLVPLTGVFLARFGRMLKKAANSAMESVAAIYDTISETFDSFRVVKAFGGHHRQRKRFLKANRDFYEHSMKCVRVSAMIRPTSEILGVLIVVLAFTPGAYMVLRNTDSFLKVQLAEQPMTITELILFYGLMAGTLDPIRKLSSVFGQVKQGLVGADRAFELIDRKPIVREPDSAMPIKRHRESVMFEDVTFRYATFDGDSAQEPALNNVSLKVDFDEVVAVVGSNGSGKSTLLNLLPRFMEPESGTIRIDGVNIDQYRSGDLRSQIGLVSQETMLFDDTVFENIRYGDSGISRAAAEDAARKSHAWKFISELPGGMDSPVGPGGRKLSGGQRQRLALARAIVRDPSILILDEATSAVDAESEDLIHGVLKEFCKGRTVFIITHVLSETFLDLVDRIVVMEQGRIVAVGSHESLFESCSTYRRLVQSGNQPRAAA